MRQRGQLRRFESATVLSDIGSGAQLRGGNLLPSSSILLLFPVFCVLFLVVGEGLCVVMVVVMMVVYDGGL
jgi:hypothetical protein